MKTTLICTILSGLILQLVAAGPVPKPLEMFPGKSDLEAAVYPLGWANNGTHIALLIAQPNEAADERNWEVVITDLASDKVVFTKAIQYPAEAGFARFWSEHGNAVEAACREQGVERVAMRVHPFPALLGRNGQDIYEAHLGTHWKEEPNFLYDGINKLELKLSNEGKEKTILEKSWPQWFPLSASLVGYIPNPEGTRIAVLLSLVERGYEGPPHTRHVLITGSRVGERF